MLNLHLKGCVYRNQLNSTNLNKNYPKTDIHTTILIANYILTCKHVNPILNTDNINGIMHF